MNTSEMRRQKRKELVEAMVLRNKPIVLVARIFKVSLRTAFDWLSRYRQGGWHALNETARLIRPRKISGEAMGWLYDAITMGGALNDKLAFCLWSLNSLRTLLHKERGVLFSKNSLCRLMSHLSLTSQRALYTSYQQAPDQIRTDHAHLYFLEEASLRSDAYQGTTWGKSGETSVVKNSSGRFGYTPISAVSARGDMHFEAIKTSMDADVFIDFLKKLHQDAGQPIFVIADNARYHHRIKIRTFLDTQQGKITMAFLPAHSPELNPDEQVWNHAKAEVSKRPIESTLEIESSILSAMRSIQQKTEAVKRFFRLPDTLYAGTYEQ